MPHRLEPGETQRKEALSRTSRFKLVVGCLMIFFAAACFYFSTAVVRWSQKHVALDPAYFVFVRFLFGFVIVCLSLSFKRQPLKPKRYELLIGRAAANSIAVYCFYTAVAKTTLAEANILNMTYPEFVTVLSWLFLKKQRDLISSVGALVACAGIWLILARGPLHFGWIHLWGLGSGFSASLAMIFLNLSRQYHDTETILFYLFGFGTIATYAAFYKTIHWPSGTEFYYLAMCSGLAILGQYGITFGYRYVTAVEGGVFSSTRILLAAALGPFVAAEPFMDVRGYIGAGLIFLVNVILALRKSKKTKQQVKSAALHPATT